MKTYVNQLKNRLSKSGGYNLHQELIWDSGAGFDVVSYVGISSLFNGKMYLCKLKTGIMKGKIIPIYTNQLKVFSLRDWSEMRRKYDQVG